MLLKQRLDYHYKAFDKSKISPDPLQFLHLFHDEKDIETIGLISSIFSYGNVNQIISTLNKIVNVLGEHPYDVILNLNSKDISKYFKSIIHRFYTESDIQSLFKILHLILLKEKSIKKIFLNGYHNATDEKNLKFSLSHFSNYFFKYFKKAGIKISPGIRFMFADPLTGSSCKRLNLFLRWMVRKDELDFGFWSEIPTGKLVIPVDTHVARICLHLNLTKRKNVSWKMAEEITENLKCFDPDDPVKYDFAICHIGIRKMEF
jgi:uncharacterized protein (TIGR02757 family)